MVYSTLGIITTAIGLITAVGLAVVAKIIGIGQSGFLSTILRGLFPSPLTGLTLTAADVAVSVVRVFRNIGIFFLIGGTVFIIAGAAIKSSKNNGKKPSSPQPLHQ